MFEKNWRDLSRNVKDGRAFNPRLLALMAAAVVSVLLSESSPAQSTATAPADTAAASGMTSGLPGVSPQRQAEMMVIRARAQAARPEAERAAMERSADEALAQKSQEELLQETREMKTMKEQAARQLEHQRAANAYRAVTAGELNSWADNSGRVKVERGVPPQILASLPEEEEPIVAEEESGFNPFKLPKKAASAASGAAGAVVGAAKKSVSWVPGLKKEEARDGITATPQNSGDATAEKEPGFFSRIGKRGEEPSPTAVDPADASGEKKGLMRGLASKIPFVGGKDETETPTQTAPAPAPTSAPVPAAVGPVASGAPVPEPPQDGGFFKKLPLIGGNSRKPEEPAQAITDPGIPAPSEPAASEKPGMLGGIVSAVGRVVPGGKDRSEPGATAMAGGDGQIDASLFPQEGDPEKLMADPSAGKKKLLSLPELPKLSMPSIPAIAAAAPETKAPQPDRSITPVHSGGHANYVVHRDGAQFMRYGAGPLGSEARSLPAGTVVTKTKVGDDWSTIMLADGSTGIIRNGDLKPASGGPSTSIAGPVAPKPAAVRDSAPPAISTPAPARIPRTVSATDAAPALNPAVLGPQPSVPVSTLTDTGSGSIPPPPIPPAP